MRKLSAPWACQAKRCQEACRAVTEFDVMLASYTSRDVHPHPPAEPPPSALNASSLMMDHIDPHQDDVSVGAKSYTKSLESFTDSIFGLPQSLTTFDDLSDNKLISNQPTILDYT